ncbi:MAG: 2-C-methyl-D-erythritol 2,4-cyclodiphosphate synthase [Candidatus Saccharicenans sp.]|jgi:2-C-methyl-D-erythritol 2,4-cyclodiphosphate synthase|nr:2-C-methyl-D-erythritol 2,4-cyclodiphosphate synthase [Candidatus Saccharicenans sp.]MDH7493604.1 2-C-methyl-D-erythritol 2,4-cyclodiphosphate synthase [Candidatus Saccharicenans sp.]
MKLKAGLGYDLHRLVPGRRLIIGGVAIPSDRGCLAHSDGDVLVHSLIDALLGAAGAGDIGQRFPDTDPAYEGISSLELLRRVMAEVRAAGLTVVNTDSVLILEKPRLAPYMAAMKANLAPLLGIEADHIGLKAKTAEGLGDIGAGQAVACWTVALLGS